VVILNSILVPDARDFHVNRVPFLFGTNDCAHATNDDDARIPPEVKKEVHRYEHNPLAALLLLFMHACMHTRNGSRDEMPVHDEARAVVLKRPAGADGVHRHFPSCNPPCSSVDEG
jgi:hypothetical protein